MQEILLNMDKLSRLLQELNIPIAPQHTSNDGMRTHSLSVAKYIEVDLPKDFVVPTDIPYLKF